MDTQSGQFRVYRAVESVRHINFQAVAEPQLYSVYETGYPADQQDSIDELQTGDLVTATLEGDADAPNEAWRVASVTRNQRVPFGFAVDLVPEALPQAAQTLAADSGFETAAPPTEPAGTTLSADGDDIGECWIQPRATLPNEAFVPNVVTGLLPIEPWIDDLPALGVPATEVLVLDTAAPTAERYETPYGVFLFFTDAGRAVATDYRDRYDCPRAVDSRPDFDPY